VEDDWLYLFTIKALKFSKSDIFIHPFGILVFPQRKQSTASWRHEINDVVS
jgi:hypothetical protein